MMYGGTAMKKPRKKAYGGHDVNDTYATEHVYEAATASHDDGGGDVAMKGDLDKDGKMSGYEKARQTAINKSMASKGKKKTSA